jgi:hypothetical protein
MLVADYDVHTTDGNSGSSKNHEGIAARQKTMNKVADA